MKWLWAKYSQDKNTLYIGSHITPQRMIVLNYILLAFFLIALIPILAINLIYFEPISDFEFGLVQQLVNYLSLPDLWNRILSFFLSIALYMFVAFWPVFLGAGLRTYPTSRIYSFFAFWLVGKHIPLKSVTFTKDHVVVTNFFFLKKYFSREKSIVFEAQNCETLDGFGYHQKSIIVQLRHDGDTTVKIATIYHHKAAAQGHKAGILAITLTKMLNKEFLKTELKQKKSVVVTNDRIHSDYGTRPSLS